MAVRNSGAVCFSNGCRSVTVQLSVGRGRLWVDMHGQEVVESESVQMRDVGDEVHEIRKLVFKLAKML